MSFSLPSLTNNEISRIFLYQSKNGYILLNNSLIADINDSACNFIGHQKEEIIGRDISRLVSNVSISFNNKSLNPKDYFSGNLNQNVPVLFSFRNINKITYSAQAQLIHVKDNLFALLTTDVTKYTKSLQMQETLYEISNELHGLNSLKDVIAHIREILSRIIDTENFYVAFYDKESDTLSLPYFADNQDSFKDIPAGKTLTGYVIKTGKPLLARKSEFTRLEESGEIELIGSESLVWLGVPLKVGNKVTGMIGVQSYEDEYAYTDEHLELLEFVSSQIGINLQRKISEESYKIEQAYFQKVFEGSPVGISITDANGNILRANPAFAKMFGYNADKAEGKNLDKLVTPELLIEESAKLTQRILNGETFTVETSRKKKNGMEIFVSIAGAPIYLEKEKLIACCSIYRDITLQKHHEYNLIRAKKRAEEADMLKSSFLANMSHEIRSPMNAIIGFSNLLEREGITPAQREEFVNIIKTSSKSLMVLINDIIDISKIEAKQLSIAYSQARINQMLDEIHLFYTQELKQQEKKLDLNLNKGVKNTDFSFRTDPNRLRQILINLMGNAIKFTDKGSVSYGYSILENDSIEFFVKDTGLGMRKEDLKKIFKRFMQTAQTITRGYGGTGLGLAISKNLVEMMNGKMRVESEKGVGSEFSFTLPLIDPFFG